MLLGIDLGTSSAKALLLNLDGTVISEASSSYSVRSDRFQRCPLGNRRALDGLKLIQ